MSLTSSNNKNINQRHAVVCRYLYCDKDSGNASIKKWDAYQEYHFLFDEFSNNTYSKAKLHSILNFYYDNCVLIYRYDLFYACAFAICDSLLKSPSSELFVHSLAVDLKSPNELDTFYIEHIWNHSNMERGCFYHLIQTLTKNKGLKKKDKYSILDLNRPTLGSTLGAEKILHWDKDRELGFVSYPDEDLFKACKKMISSALNANRNELIELLYTKDRLLLEEIENKRHYNNNKLVNNIIFYTGTRLGVCDNPKYVLQGVLKDPYFKDFTKTWVAHKVELCQEIEDVCKIIPLNNHQEVLDSLSKAKIIIYNDDLPNDFVTNKKQILINLWHGAINYKKIGFDSYEFQFNPYIRELFAFANPEPDIFVAGSESFLKTTEGAFKYSKRVFLKCGLPRNDLLFHYSDDLVKNIKKKLGVPLDKKVVLYAPTWRKGNRADLHGLDIKGLLESLSKRFGGEYVFLYRGHTFTTNFWNGVNNAVDVSNYPDSHEVLIISDVLISDYSSFIYDAAIIKKPVFLFTPDLKEYLDSERGFYIDINKIPFSSALTNDDLKNNIERFNLDNYLLNIQKHLKETGSFDKGDATDLVIEALKKVLESK